MKTAAARHDAEGKKLIVCADLAIGRRIPGTRADFEFGHDGLI
jgi:hypothetical protein